MINWKVRIRNKAFWLALIPAVLLLAQSLAAAVGYACIRLLKMIADKGRFGAFAYYCWAAGLATLILNAVK